MMGVIFDERSTMKAKCEDRNVRYDEWPDVVMDGISVKMQKQKKGSVWIT